MPIDKKRSYHSDRQRLASQVFKSVPQGQFTLRRAATRLLSQPCLPRAGQAFALGILRKLHPRHLPRLICGQFHELQPGAQTMP
jgi:hypothetical protein